MPFHAATKPNMAALLRSARLLRFSPSGLLQVTGTKRNGPPLSRLYGGAVGGRTRRVAAGVEHAPRQVWPCASGTMRGYAVATEQREDASLGVRSKQAQSFDWALAKLDSSVRRTGRITKTQLLRIFHDICRTGYPSGNQALLLLRSCGSLLPEMPLAERTELAHRIWDKLQTLAASYDASHYNALLKVYLQNEFKFSPTEFLAKMEAANVTPNRVTYQRLIAAYCQTGDIEGASTILGFMKSKDLPITEAVFNSLLTGHAKAGDLESAVNILPVMRGAGIEPGPDTYVALLTAYADKGDMENIKKTMETVEAENSSLMDRDLMQVIFALAMAGHEQHIPELVERMRHERGYVPDAMNLCLSLITQGQEDTAFTILKTFPTLQADNQNSDSPILGSFFLRHIVNMEKPVEKIVRYCEELQDANLHASPLLFALSCALEAKNTELSFELMKAVKQQGLPLRPHYFWPLLVQHVKLHNTAGVLEVLKGMQELGVAPDVETFNNYIIPVFPDNDTARQTLKEMGYSLGLEGHHSSEIRKVASSDLAALYTKLSDPSFPEMDLIGWRASLITGFRKSDNVEDMVKITEFLYNDPRFCRDNSTPIEAVAYFLYYLIDSMGEAVLQEQEEKLRQYFHKLKAHNIVIPYNVYRGIRNILAKANFHGLVKDVLILVDPNDAGANSFPRVTGVEGKLLMLEKNLAELKEQDKPLGPTLKQLILLLCAEDKLERALELKRQYFDEIAADGYAGGYAALINLCCRHGNLEEAINLKTELSRKDSSVALDAPKYLALVQLLTKNDRMDEAVDVLKEMKEKNVMLKENHVTTLFHLLNSMGLKGDIEAIRRIQDTVFTLGLTRPSANLCSPLISAYLQNNDMSGALEAAMGIHKMYKQMPRIHDIIVAMVEKGDTDLLQKTMDFVSEERGEMTMLYDLFFAFMQTGRYREARKIIETPGLRARPGRLHWYAEKCINNSQMEPLENMVEVTAKLFECDRDEMYHYMLRLCKEKNDFRKAEAAWTKMQEENVVPRERTLRLLADILKSNGQEVPFEEPETWYENVSTKEMAKEKVKEKVQENVQENIQEIVQEMVQEKVQVVTEAPSSRMALPAKEIDYSSRMVTLCKKKKPKEAYGLLKESEKKAVAVSPAAYDVLIRTLLAEGSLEDAMQVKDMAAARVSGFQLNERANSLLIVTLSKKGQGKDGLATLKSMLQAVQVPSALAITRLVQTLGAEGDAASIQEVDSLTKALGSPLTVTSMLFPNNMALAHIRSGDVDSAIEVLEALYTVTEPQSFFPSMSFVFRKVLEENNDKAMDKLSAMAERLANHFACYRPATDLFLELLEIDKVEDAKFMLARCNAVAEQKPVLLSYLSRLSQKPGNVGKVKSLMTLIPDFAEKDVQYGYMIKCFAQDNDLASAKDLHELMEKEGMNLDELSLKRLAVLYRNAGEAVPFTEPPESFVFYAEKLKGKKAQAAAEE